MVDVFFRFLLGGGKILFFGLGLANIVTTGKISVRAMQPASECGASVA
jgi:hypothetical protein